MNLPLIETNIFKKLKLLELILKLEKQSELQLEYRKINDSQGAFPNWEMEKKILQWTYLGHKHWHSPIKSDLHFRLPEETSDSKLQDWLITKDELNKTDAKRILGNLIVKGFANEITEIKNDNSIHVLISDSGHQIGSILWKITKIVPTETGEIKLSIKKRIKIGYRCIIIGSYFLYFFLASILISELLNKLGYGSILNSWILQITSLNIIFGVICTIVALLVLSLFIIGFFLIGDYKRDLKKIEELKKYKNNFNTVNGYKITNLDNKDIIMP